jgi:hypothetical protein
MRGHQANLSLLLALIHPHGDFPLLIRLYKKRLRASGGTENKRLRDFFSAFDSDLHTLYLDLKNFKATSHGTPLPQPVLELLGRLDKFVTCPSEGAQVGDFPRLLYIKGKYNHELPNIKFTILRVDDELLCEEVLTTLDASIVSLEEAIGTDPVSTFDGPTIFREEPNFNNWHGNNEAIQTLRKKCCCRICDCPGIRLGLATNRKSAEDFSLQVLLALDGETRQWREVSLYVRHPRTTRKPKVSFGDETSIPLESLEEKDFDMVTSLCKQMQNPKAMRLRLEWRVQDNNVWQRKRRYPVTYTTKELEHVVPLTDLLSGSLTVNHRIRTILAVILGHSLLQFYGSPWLQFWSREHIVFIRKGKTLPLKPFLLTGPLSGIEEDESYSCHPYPSILALGTMLLEMELHRPLEAYTDHENMDRDPMIVALEVFKKEKRHMLKDYSKAIEACLDANFGYDEGYEEGSEDFRRLIYENIVRPLEDQLEIGFLDKVENLDEVALSIDLSDFRGVISYPTLMTQDAVSSYPPSCIPESTRLLSPVKLSTSNAFSDTRSPLGGPLQSRSPPRSRSPLVGLRSRLQTQPPISDSLSSASDFKLFDDHNSAADGELTDEWFKSLRPVQQIIHQSDPPGVKIAILDSGIDLDHSDMIAVEERIKDIRSWVNGGNGMRIPTGGDSHGHGTHVAGIILDVANLADVYIAKITQNGTLHDYESIAKAITYAATQWKVDIITMSFGFPNRIPAIEAAIHDADCLIFAAAANHGGNHDRAYPAKHDSVICIHSTNGRGRRSDFNPPPLRQSDNFSIVGEAINSAWPGEDEFKRKSGTSFATPVAAGLAAFVLEYGAQNLQDEQDKLQRLRTPEGMKDVFRLMTAEVDGYQYIRPWELFDRKKKEWTRTSILKALE